MKKYFFFKNCLRSFSKHSQMTAFVKLIPKRYITWGHNTRYVCARSVHGLYSVHGTYRVQRPQVIYLFGISLTYAVIWECFKKDRRQFLKKNIFSSKGPPFGFWGICPKVIWPIPGVNFKLETSSFHRSSSFCDVRRHVSARIEIQKFCSTLHP